MPEGESWIVLELSFQGERLASDGSLLGLFCAIAHLDDEQEQLIFVPYSVLSSKNSKYVLNVMEGYCFVHESIPEDALSIIINSEYVSGTVSQGRNNYGTVDNKAITGIKNKLGEMISSKLERGQPVRVTGGPLKSVRGIVQIKGSTSSCVHFSFRSMETMRVVFNYLLEPVDAQ